MTTHKLSMECTAHCKPEDRVVVVIVTDLAPSYSVMVLGHLSGHQGHPGTLLRSPVSHLWKPGVSQVQSIIQAQGSSLIHILISSLRPPCFSKRLREIE